MPIQPFEVEPAQFGMTGPGIASGKVQMGFIEDVVSYSIDAPRYIPYGGVNCSELDSGLFYAATTVSRE